MNRILSRALLSFVTVIAFAAVICFAHLRQGTLAVDAIRYAHISMQLSEGVPYSEVLDGYRGVRYVNKPPLLFWLTAQSFRIFGRSTATAKAPAVAFVFLAILLLYGLTAREYGRTAALWAVGLLSANRSFGRDLLDFSFDGMSLFGTLLCLAGALDLVREDRPVDGRESLLLGLGACLLLQSKPPYVLLVVAPLFAVLVVRKLWRRVLCARCLIPLVVLTLLGASTHLAAGSEYRTQAFENQVIESFNFYQGYIANLLKWSRSFGLTLAPLSWVVVLAATSLFSKKVRSNAELLMLLWTCQIVPIILIVANRPRYLWPALCPGMLLAGGFLVQRLPAVHERTLRTLLGVAVVLLGITMGAGFVLHRANQTVLALRGSPELLQTPGFAVCIGGRDTEQARRSVQQTSLLIQFEFHRSSLVFAPEALPPDTKIVLADTYCRDALKWRPLHLMQGATVLQRPGTTGDGKP